MAAPKDGFGGGAGRASWESSRAFQGCQTRGYACKPCSHFQKVTCLSSLSKTILRRVLHAWTTEARIEHYLLRSLPPPALKESIRIQHSYQHPSRLNFQKGLFTPVRTSMELHSKDMKRRKQRFEVQHLDGRVSRRNWARAVGELLSLKTILLAFTDNQPMWSPAQTGEPQPGPQRQGAQCFENIPIVGCPVMGTWQ